MARIGTKKNGIRIMGRMCEYIWILLYYHDVDRGCECQIRSWSGSCELISGRVGTIFG